MAYSTKLISFLQFLIEQLNKGKINLILIHVPDNITTLSTLLLATYSQGFLQHTYP